MPNQKHRKKIIKSTVSIHDRTQVETIFSYYLNPQSEKKVSAHRYRVDAFLFFPVQTAVNSSTYTRQQFYNDLRSFIRLREPRLSYKEMLGQMAKDSPYQSGLGFMRNFVQNARQGDVDDEGINNAIEEARVFGCEYVSFYWRRIDRRRKRLAHISRGIGRLSPEERITVSERFSANTIKFLTKGYELLREWRKAYGEVSKLNSLKYSRLVQEMELVDEYCSYCFRDGLLRLLRNLEESFDTSDIVGFSSLRRKISAYLRLERVYARKYNLLWVYDDSEQVLKENYIYRRGALKRRIWSVLYLNPRTDLIFRFQKQTGPMIAAGLAAGWATTASLMIGINVTSLSEASRFIGALSAGSMSLIVMLFVGAYILKDRIKELGRRWFERGLFRSNPDLDNSIYYTSVGGRKLKIGQIQEFADFVKTDKIPQKIIDLRKASLRKRYRYDDSFGATLHYRKFISLAPKQLAKLNQPLRAVQDIIRLNISSYLTRLDDPMHLALAPTRENHAVEVMMPKVYHIDFILRYYPLSNHLGSDATEIIDFYRIVVDKRGMARIDQII